MSFETKDDIVGGLKLTIDQLDNYVNEVTKERDDAIQCMRDSLETSSAEEMQNMIQGHIDDYDIPF